MFSESSNSSATTDDSKQTQKECCKFFALNRWCRYGSRCKFLHESSWRESVVNYSGERRPWTSQRRIQRFSPQANEPNEVISAAKDQEEPESCKACTDEHHPIDGHQVEYSGEPLAEDLNQNEEKKKSEQKTTDLPVCQYFRRRGGCHFGERCRFAHSKSNRPELPSNNQRRNGQTRMQQARHIDAKICVHFKRGNCRNGKNCRFLHSSAATPADEHLKTDTANGNFEEIERKPFIKQEYLLADVSQDELAQLRQTEMQQLQKRFTKDNITQLEGEEGWILSLSPSDPDWPFDISILKIRISFPLEYPKLCPVTELNCEDNESLPLGLVRYLATAVKDWFQKKQTENEANGKVTLLFRPFLKWFDKNMEELFTLGLKLVKRDIEAKSAGLEFVPFEQLTGSQNSEKKAHDDTTSEQDIPPPIETLTKLITRDDKDDIVVSDLKLTTSDRDNSTKEDQIIPLNPDDFKVPKKGTEMKLRNCQLGETVASVVCQKLHVTVQCLRCKACHDINTEPRRRNLFSCTKCHLSHQLTFRPSLLHQYNACLGYLDLEGCQAFDLPIVDCVFAVECLTCNKQMSSDGLHYGQMWTSWCHHCNEKLSFYVDSVKFQQLQPNLNKDTGAVNVIKLERKDKKVKDPAIQEGKPLPDYGTCKHFKKSYRWFRFPCCGKAYPCDLCHNDKELEHEMKQANRIICGFCAKEQPASTKKPCILCASTMTNVSTDHWEGGKGCRDKLKMSKDDSRKYMGSNKTVSRRITQLKDNTKKPQQKK